VDVGGGQGALILELLRQQPHLTALLFDSPDVVENSTDRLEQAGLSDRCQVVSGNFLESVPTGGDVYLGAKLFGRPPPDNGNAEAVSKRLYLSSAYDF
jgi:hypothetical protein